MIHLFSDFGQVIEEQEPGRFTGSQQTDQEYG
jgi:hypothetical protein